MKTGKTSPGLSSYRDLLTERAESYRARLKQAGFRAILLEDSYREFVVQIEAFHNEQSLGKIALYYSPKRNTFTPVFQGIREKTLIPRLEEIWLKPSTSRAGRWEAYVDGSYSRGRTGYGAVLLCDSRREKEFSGRVPFNYSHSRQVGGELYAVCEVVRYCQAEGITDLAVYYDYFGIEKWATGQWRTNLPLTREYARFIKSSPVRIRWVKVRGHSGNRWNDRADTLARQGCTEGR